MNVQDLKKEFYDFQLAAGGYRRTPRALFAVWGGEAVQFLNGLVTGDVAKIETGKAIPVAFPNAQGRIVALAAIFKHGDRFLIETDQQSREKLFSNLQRFTFAGDFHLEDLSETLKYFELYCHKSLSLDGVVFDTSLGSGIFVSDDVADRFTAEGLVVMSEGLTEAFRLERGFPVFGVDADESTVVPELGITDLISYNKGCYIGQEIVARIHFRGHVAKMMRGLVFADEVKDPMELVDDEILLSPDGKQGGRVTSLSFSPGMDRLIALATIRYEFRESGTELVTSKGRKCVVSGLPFEIN